MELRTAASAGKTQRSKAAVAFLAGKPLPELEHMKLLRTNAADSREKWACGRCGQNFDQQSSTVVYTLRRHSTTRCARRDENEADTDAQTTHNTEASAAATRRSQTRASASYAAASSSSGSKKRTAEEAFEPPSESNTDKHDDADADPVAEADPDADADADADGHDSASVSTRATASSVKKSAKSMGKRPVVEPPDDPPSDDESNSALPDGTSTERSEESFGQSNGAAHDLIWFQPPSRRQNALSAPRSNSVFAQPVLAPGSKSAPNGSSRWVPPPNLLDITQGHSESSRSTLIPINPSPSRSLVGPSSTTTSTISPDLASRSRISVDHTQLAADKLREAIEALKSQQSEIYEVLEPLLASSHEISQSILHLEGQLALLEGVMGKHR